MKIFERELGPRLRSGARSFGAVIVTGPRRSGKTFLLRRTFPDASYHLLEDPDVLSRVKADPRGFLEEVRTPAILDEVQNAPELLPYIRTQIDQRPNRRGRWLLTGSQEFSLMAGVTESMTGRAAVFQLRPLSFREMSSWDLTRGGFPEVVLRPRNASLWFRSYVQTYLERDVRALRELKSLPTFRRFMALVASRHGAIVNKTELAAPLGVSVPTITEWLSVLETTGHILLVPPYFANFGKRLIKTPKLYWVDSGLVCHLLGITTKRQLEHSPFLGAIFEGFVATEIVKNQVNSGRASEIYFFRDEQGLEVDFLVPGRAGLELVEVKWSKTISASMAAPLRRLASVVPGGRCRATIVHCASATTETPETVAPGVRTLSVEAFLSTFPSRRR